MAIDERKSDPASIRKNSPATRIRLPGFLVNEEIGLGDVIKRATASIGIRPCGGCTQRAASLNARFIFSPRR